MWVCHTQCDADSRNLHPATSCRYHHRRLSPMIMRAYGIRAADCCYQWKSITQGASHCSSVGCFSEHRLSPVCSTQRTMRPREDLEVCPPVGLKPHSCIPTPLLTCDSACKNLTPLSSFERSRVAVSDLPSQPPESPLINVSVPSWAWVRASPSQMALPLELWSEIFTIHVMNNESSP